MDTSPTQIYTLSLHDALPISEEVRRVDEPDLLHLLAGEGEQRRRSDRKSTRLNSSHMSKSYAVFCLKKKTIWRVLPPASSTVAVCFISSSFPGAPAV